MSQPPDALAESALRLAQQGDFAGAASALARAARAYRKQGQLADAARVGIAAARMATAADQLDQAAELLAELAEPARKAGQLADLLAARAELADLAGDAAAREAAWRACAGAGEPALAMKAWHRIGALARDRQDPALLLEAIEHALALASDDQAVEADLRVELAIAVGETDPARARAELDRADRLVAADDHALRSRLVGQRGVLALAAGQLDDAAARARESRALAVESNAVPAYLAATSLLVMVHERAGDQLAALDEILRARASLRDLLGDDGGALVDPALTLFEERVGTERYRELVERWRVRRKAER